MPTLFRNRVRELRTVPANELERHPGNWRTHPKQQRHTLRAMMHELGNASAVIAYEHQGRLRIIDGHLRADLQSTDPIPVLILDVSPTEADTLLLTMDPIAAMAKADEERLARLLQETDLPGEVSRLQKALEKAAGEMKTDDIDQPEPEFVARYQVVASVSDEQQQRQLYDELVRRGLDCRCLTT